MTNSLSIFLQVVGAGVCIGLLVYGINRIWNKIEKYYIQPSKIEADAVIKNSLSALKTVDNKVEVRNRWQVRLMAEESDFDGELLEGINYLSDRLVIQNRMVYFNSETEAFCIPVCNVKYIKFSGDFTTTNIAPNPKDNADERASV